MADFVHGSQGVIPGFELFSKLGDGGDDGGDDDFGSDELAQGELLIQYQPTADGEQGGASDDFEGEQPDDLPHEDAEVAAAGAEIVAGEVIGMMCGQIVAARAFEQPRVTCQLFQPTNDAIFA